MLAEFFRFDLRYQVRAPLLWVAALVFALIAFGATSSDAIRIGGAIGNVHRNAPAVIVSFFATFTVIGLFIVTVFIAQPLLRDFEMNTDELFFSTPMRTRNYVLGRLGAGFVAALIVFALTGLGMILGAAMPWVDPQQLGSFSLAPHLWSFAFLIVPNMLFAAALLSLLAVTTRSLLTVYLGVVGFFVLYTVSGFLMQDIQYDQIGSLLDPFGGRVLGKTMRYWSANERNTLLPPIDGLLLLNRALWLGIAAIMFAATFKLFRPQRFRGGKRWLRRAAMRTAAESSSHAAAAPKIAAVSRRVAFDRGTPWRQFLHQVTFDAAAVLRGVPFLVLLAFGIFNIAGSASSVTNWYGTNMMPVTASMLDVLDGSYSFLLVLIVGFYAGELVWRERNVKLAELTDTLPVPNWVPMLAKIGALLAVIVAFMLLGVLTCIAVQLFKGYGRPEIGLFVAGALLQAVPFMLMAVAAIVLQIVSNQKFLGYLLYVLLIVLQIALPPMHLEHNLYNFAGAPRVIYSDMNGFGHFLGGWFWFNLYWTLFVMALALLAAAFWVRGTASSMGRRLRQAGRDLAGVRGGALAVTLLALVSVGAWIHYNTNVLNEYIPSDVRLDRQAYYEKEYRRFKDTPQPKIVDVFAEVDIYPERRAAEVRGRYKLTNKHAVPIGELHVTMAPGARLTKFVVANAQLVKEDPPVGYRLYRLEQPLQPGAFLNVEFAVQRQEVGFTNSGLPVASGILSSPLNANGTFFNDQEMLPHFGYQKEQQILDRSERRKRGLGDVPRAAKLEDEAARENLGFNDADWIDFETIVSTSPGQIALAPGYLQREWTENGRRYFHYKMDRPMLPFYCYLSADWEVKRDKWHDVPIEIYYDAKHPYNVGRMIDGTRKSLDYFTANFSPYQHRQVRILEFPRYSRFAQSFANTVPYSEAIGFIADLRDPDDIDYVFYVTAHEVAHQWWGHQVFGADVQGQTMLVESLAQYSALMVMEREYGPTRMRKFLKYELDRYLRGRGGELIEELPLMRVENQQYIHYQKGSLVFYRLRDEIGEAALNRALSKFLADKAFQEAPFTTSKELLEYIRAETPPEKHLLLDELFAKIVFYDNRVTSAKAVQRADGKYDVTIEFSALKQEADGMGKESPLPMNDWIDVGAFQRGADRKESSEQVLYLKKHHITPATKQLSFVVDAKPYEVGLDPYNKLIDRIPDDNRKTVD